MAGEDRAGQIPPHVVEKVKRELIGIGGAQPPRVGRFKPGQSGNPKGRPKRRPDLALPPGGQGLNATTVRLAMAPVQVKDTGKTVSIPMHEAIVRAQMAAAARGNPLAQRDALQRIERALCQAGRELQDQHSQWQLYCDVKWAEIEQAKRDGKPVPNPLPHPDDVVLEPGEEVRFEGPVNEADAERCAWTCSFRDALLLQDALDEKLAYANDGDRYRSGGSYRWALEFNNLVYKRFRLTEDQLFWRVMRNGMIPKRELLKTVFQTWSSLGVNAPRGTRFASLDSVAAISECLGDLLDALRAGEIDRQEFARSEYNDVALDILGRFRAGLAAERHN